MVTNKLYPNMPKLNQYQQSARRRKQKIALELHEKGLTTREIGAVVKRSRTWVNTAVRELSPDPSLTKTDTQDTM